MLRHLLTASLIALPAWQAPAAPLPQSSQRCSMASLPEPQRRRLIDGYAQRRKAQGDASAKAWAKAQEEGLYQQLVRQGDCAPTRNSATAAPRQTARLAAKGGKQILNRQGKPCRNITVENQLFPGFGGEPMRMALVQVCKD